MKLRVFAIVAAVLISTTVLLGLLCLLGWASPGVPGPALAAPLQITPTVTLVGPASAPNDLDTPIIITGTDFVSVPAVYLGETALSDVEWVTSTVLRAFVPWGMDPGVYTLTVSNPGGESDDLPNAFTVTQGIGAWSATQLFGGNVGEVVINPITPTTVYAVAGKAGIFRSGDAGETWAFVYASDAHDLAVDPITPTTIYWGTSGLYRSDDEGDTGIWLGELVNLPYPHPTISGTVYATKRWDFGGSGGGGLWRSTDRGRTWVTATNGLTDTAVAGLVFHPTDPLAMYLGTANGNVFRSADAGDSWSLAAHPINYILALGINPRGAHELWVSNHCMDYPNLTLRSTNLEHTAWITLGEPVGTYSLESIDFPPLAWSEAFSETVFAQGCWGTPYRSGDNGETWEELPLSQVAVQDMALHPTISNTLYGGAKREGVLKSEDGGESYQWINQGITALYPLQIATVPGEPGTAYALTEQEGGVHKMTQGGADWQFLDIAGLHGSGRVVTVDPLTPSRVYVGDSGQDGAAWGLHVSEDSGQTWTTTVISATDAYSDCNNVAPRVLRPDPVHAGYLLAGLDHSRFGTPGFSAGGIYRSTDHGESWTYIDEVISGVNDIAFDALMTTTVYAASGSPGSDIGSGMLRSTDSGESWQPMGEGIAALDCVWSIAVEPRAPYRVFAMTFSDGLYLSEDHGLTWTQGAPWLVSEEILYTDEAPPALYAAWGGGGLLRSTDGGQSWQRAAGTLGHVPIYSLATVTATDRVILYAGTTGGYVESGAAQVLSAADNGGTLVNAGMYRYTTRRTFDLYLPLVLKAYAP